MPHIEEEHITACKNICKLCERLIISDSVAYDEPNLAITLPAGSYYNGEKYCIVVAQTIPAETPVDAPVVVQIGDGTVTYPLTTCDCRTVTARSIRTRTKYSAIVKTSPTAGTFRLLGKLCNITDGLQFIDGNAPT